MQRERYSLRELLFDISNLQFARLLIRMRNNRNAVNIHYCWTTALVDRYVGNYVWHNAH